MFIKCGSDSEGSDLRLINVNEIKEFEVEFSDGHPTAHAILYTGDRLYVMAEQTHYLPLLLLGNVDLTI